MPDQRTKRERNVRPHDFQHQEGLERARLRRLQPVLEVLAHRAAAAMSSVLRAPVHCEVGELRQDRWEAYAAELAEPMYLSSIEVITLPGRLIVYVPNQLAFSLVERRLGGNGLTPALDRPLTDIEQRLGGEMVQAVLDEIPAAFAAVTPVTLGASTTVSSPVFLQSSRLNDQYLIVDLNVDFDDDAQLSMALCIPFSVLLPVIDALERTEDSEGQRAGRSWAAVRERMLEVPVTVHVCYPDIEMLPEELLSLEIGDCITLGQHNDTLHMRVGDTEVNEVVQAVVGKRLAAMVVEPSSDRLRAAATIPVAAPEPAVAAESITTAQTPVPAQASA